MKDYHLKFTSKTAAKTALLAMGFKEDEESGQLYHANVAMRVIGTMYTVTDSGTVDAEGYPILTSTPKSGWHINLRCWGELEVPEKYIIHPETPSEVWA